MVDSAAAASRGATKLSGGKLVSYGLPSLGMAAVGIMTGTFLPRFYSDNVGVPLAQISVVAAAVPVFDALTDPLAGWASDNSKSKHGRRKPFFVVGSILMAVSFAALFSPPRGSSASPQLQSFLPRNATNSSEQHETAANHTTLWCASSRGAPSDHSGGGLRGETIYAAVMLFLLTLFMTIARQAWLAWGVDLSRAAALDDGAVDKGRWDPASKVAVARELPFALGCLVAAILPVAADALTDDAFVKFLILGLTWASVIGLSVLPSVWTVPDVAPQNPGQQVAAGEGASTVIKTSTVGAFLRRIWGNRAAVTLYAGNVLYGIATYTNGLLYSYFVPYVLEAEATEWILAMYIGAGLLAVPGWAWLTTRYEKKYLLAAAISVQSFALYVAFFAVGSGDVALYAGLVATAGVSFSGAPTLYHAMVAHVADSEVLRSGGCRDEAKILGLYDLTKKLLAAVSISIALPAIDTAGYVPCVVPQSDPSKLAIRIWYALVPAVLGTLAAGIVLLGYDLSNGKHARILEKIASESGGVGGGDDENGTDGGDDSAAAGNCDHSVVELVRTRKAEDAALS